jgi:hypothetical protein
MIENFFSEKISSAHTPPSLTLPLRSHSPFAHTPPSLSMPPYSTPNPVRRSPRSVRRAELIFSDDATLDNRPVISIAVIGDPNVGKTAYVKRLVSTSFSSEYIPSDELESNLILFQTCVVNLIVPQCIGGVYQTVSGVNGYMLMFDETRVQTFDNVLNTNTLGLPSVFCGMKSDLVSGVLDGEYFAVSAKTTSGMMTPLETVVDRIIRTV